MSSRTLLISGIRTRAHHRLDLLASTMKQPNLIFLFLATVAAIGLVIRISHESSSASTPIYARERPKTSAAGAAKTQAPVPTSNSSTSNEAIGESILRDYGDAA